MEICEFSSMEDKKGFNMMISLNVTNNVFQVFQSICFGQNKDNFEANFLKLRTKNISIGFWFFDIGHNSLFKYQFIDQELLRNEVRTKSVDEAVIDQHGAVLKAISLDWNPWHTLYNCEDNKNCEG